MGLPAASAPLKPFLLSTMAALSSSRTSFFFSTASPHPKPRRISKVVRMAYQENGPSLAVVGVTGAVGQEFLSVLSDRDFPYRSIKMLASKRSAGKSVRFHGEEHIVEELTADSFDGVDIALFSAGGSISKHFGPLAVEKGTIVVDNSSAFRMDENVPLVIPEVNPEAMKGIKVGKGKGALIANPNCSTIICLMAVTPLHRHAKVLKSILSFFFFCLHLFGNGTQALFWFESLLSVFAFSFIISLPFDDVSLIVLRTKRLHSRQENGF